LFLHGIGSQSRWRFVGNRLARSHQHERQRRNGGAGKDCGEAFQATRPSRLADAHHRLSVF